MAEYTIARVSAQAPSSWSFNDKRTGKEVQMETYKVMLKGINEPVDITRKPGNTPQVNEVLAGTIEDTDYGKKFKKDPTPLPGRGSTYTPKDTAEIKAQWAIGQSVSLTDKFAKARIVEDTDKKNEPTIKEYWESIEQNASKLFLMVERVKQSKDTEAKGPDTVFPVTDEAVDLGEIPF